MVGQLGPAVASRSGEYRLRLMSESLVDGSGRALPEGAKLLAWVELESPTLPGARLRVRGVLRHAASPSSPGWWRSYLRRQQIAARLDVDHIELAGRRGGVSGLRERWRAWASHHAGAGLSGDRRAVVRGMALGGGADLSEDAAQSLRDAGVWHLLAVSGQNVTVVALAVLGLLRAAGVGRSGSLAGALIALLAYCVACDGGPSVARAGVVGALGLVGEFRSVARQRWHLLIVAMAMILAWDPRALGDPGLQLSFAAVAGLFVTAPVATEFLAGWLPGRIAQLAGLAVGAGFATAPVVVWHFERLSLAGLGVNIIAVPVAAPVVVIALVGIPAAAIWSPLGEATNTFAGLGAAVILGVSRLAAGVPGAALDLPRWSAIGLVLLPVAPHLLREVGPRLSGAQRRSAVVVVVLAVGLGVLALSPRHEPWPDVPEARILDVGQGNATLIRDPDGRAALIDTGPPGDPAAIASRLARLGVERLDLLVISHGSLDHVGGVPEVRRRATPRVVALGPEVPPEQADRLRSDFETVGARVVEVAAGAVFPLGDWRVGVLSPVQAGYRGGDPNPRSLVLHAHAEGASLIVTSDAESDALSGIGIPSADMFVVAHHGSRDAGLERLLGRVDPSVAAISVGSGNQYGHPTPETLAVLRRMGIPVRRTDRDGDVWLRAEGGQAVVGSG